MSCNERPVARARRTKAMDLVEREDSLGVILGEIAAWAVDDAKRRASEERAKAEREIRWQAAMEEARGQAVQDQLAEALRAEAGRWQEANALKQ